ncbi:CRISPR-associated helicase Cas3' [Lacticaseibacillus parakribbianus]|uniref:CRISPR-associated helicase Cas3' n=1 Tax=Lacticaseibacillus parakribbianus TaxID=2970927 RepID=UPI0021CAE999|nr:CRISPR-associated helicase Cas3' [Lacticaseibacillus parakribbianus]
MISEVTTYTPQEQALWAKKRTEDGRQAWLPLLAHLEDTERVINWLYQHWLSDSQRAFIAADLGEDVGPQLAKFLGFTHDLGKATPVFQTKRSYDCNQSLDGELIERLLRVGFHDLNGLECELTAANASPHALAGEALLERAGVPDAVAAIVGGHHGRPANRTPWDQIRKYTKNYWQADQDVATQQTWQNVQKHLIACALQRAGYASVTDVPQVAQPQAVLLEGLLIMADWLASSESLGDADQTPLFPLIGLDQGFDDLDMQGRFEAAMTHWYLGEDFRPEPVTLAEDPYRKRWGFTPRPVQRAVTEAIAAAAAPGLVILEAPMGVGKTETALLAAEQLAYQCGQTGLFFGLPTQATANAMFDRVADWLGQLPGGVEAVRSLELMHGKAAFNPRFRALPAAANVEGAGAVSVNEWFSGKKRILDAYTVGTIDNLLVMALKQKHLALKHLGLSKKVVVLDEVHAYDAYMGQYLYRAVEWLGTYRVPVVILSATLPKARRNALLAAYYRGRFGKRLERHADLSELPADWSNTAAYPLLTLLDGRTVRQVTQFGGTSDQAPLTVSVRRLAEPADEPAAMQDVAAAIAGGGVAGVIVNTVRRAQALAAAAPSDVPVVVLHSAFLAPDRARLEAKLQQLIGKNATRPARLIVIGTQVLEQSLDIDFDILYTDIAPMDLLLQRIGRLHRHAIARPKPLVRPQVVVMGIQGLGDYGDANATIYSQYLLMRTDAALEAAIQLLHQISQLVQEVYDPLRDPAIAGLAAARAEFETRREQAEAKARVFRLEAADPTATLHGWLADSQQNVDRDVRQAEAAVRDIQETLEVILLRRGTAGLQLLDGRPLEGCPSATVATQLIRLPHAVTPNVGAAITALEEATREAVPDWQADKWLRGALALVLDGQGAATLGDWRLQYDAALGLSYQKKE